MSRYLEASEQVGAWLESIVVPEPEGWTWPVAPGAFNDDVMPGLAWGTASPTLFFVEAFRTTGDLRWHDDAMRGATWLDHNLDTVSGLWAGCGLFTGIGGWVVVFDELARAEAVHGVGDGGERARAWTVRALEKVLAGAELEGGAAGAGAGAGKTCQWHGLTEILWGTAGIGCLLLTQGTEHLGDRAIDAAVGAGNWLLGQAEPAGDGLQWALGPGFNREGRDPRFPNFAHGAAGIGFFLARLAEVTREDRFLGAAQQAAAWIRSIGRDDGETFAVCREPNDGPDEYPFGWCHGPAGLTWFFRQLAIADPAQAADWHDLMRRSARTTRTSGIPERREPGFWDNVARCCGSAGVAEVFLDLHTHSGSTDDLDFAQTMVDDLLNRAIVDAAGMRWSNFEHRSDPPDLPPQATYFQGAPGIGSTLLRLHRHLAGDGWTVRWPHSPAWGGR